MRQIENTFRQRQMDSEQGLIHSMDYLLLESNFSVYKVMCSTLFSPVMEGHLWICPCQRGNYESCNPQCTQITPRVRTVNSLHTAQITAHIYCMYDMMTDSFTSSPRRRFSFLSFRLLISTFIADIWQRRQ